MTDTFPLGPTKEASHGGKKARAIYPPEYRERIVELVRVELRHDGKQSRLHAVEDRCHAISDGLQVGMVGHACRDQVAG